jgi:hypothetical protein
LPYIQVLTVQRERQKFGTLWPFPDLQLNGIVWRKQTFAIFAVQRH